jgi:hypothetical protein
MPYCRRVRTRRVCGSAEVSEPLPRCHPLGETGVKIGPHHTRGLAVCARRHKSSWKILRRAPRRGENLNSPTLQRRVPWSQPLLARPEGAVPFTLNSSQARGGRPSRKSLWGVAQAWSRARSELHLRWRDCSARHRPFGAGGEGEPSETRR